MCTVWHVDKYKITFKLSVTGLMKSFCTLSFPQFSRGPVLLMPAPGTGPRPGGWETLI